MLTKRRVCRFWELVKRTCFAKVSKPLAKNGHSRMVVSGTPSPEMVLGSLGLSIQTEKVTSVILMQNTSEIIWRGWFGASLPKPLATSPLHVVVDGTCLVGRVDCKSEQRPDKFNFSLPCYNFVDNQLLCRIHHLRSNDILKAPCSCRVQHGPWRVTIS